MPAATSARRRSALTADASLVPAQAVVATLINELVEVEDEVYPVPRRLSSDRPSRHSRGRGVFHRARTVACARGDLHPRRCDAAAREPESTKRIAGNRCVGVALRLRRDALLRRTRVPGRAERSARQLAVCEHRRLGCGAAHFGVGAGAGESWRGRRSRTPSGASRPFAAYLEEMLDAPARRDGRLHAAHVDTRTAERAAVRGGHGHRATARACWRRSPRASCCWNRWTSKGAGSAITI